MPDVDYISKFDAEVRKGERFEFGKNWQSFLSTLTDERIRIAEDSVKEMLRVDNLAGKTVLDIGSGSGLFSLAARNLGARVLSFDYDPASVACTQGLQTRYFPNDAHWIVQKGSILDAGFVGTMGRFDVVYSWGVLHHTGDMWLAIDHAASLVKENGVLFIALYNNQGWKSRFWRKVKRFYCSGSGGRMTATAIFIPYFFCRALLSCLVRKENVFSSYRNKYRGMSITHDWFDWLGGFPFEVAAVEEVFEILRVRGFRLSNIRTTNGWGNNEFVFVRGQDRSPGKKAEKKKGADSFARRPTPHLQ